MKKLILGLALSAFAFGLQADQSAPATTPSCCTMKMSSGCPMKSCGKPAPKVQSPKGAEQFKK